MAKGVNKETGFDIVTTADVELEMQTEADADGYLMHPVNPYFHYINLTARQLGLLWENALESYKSGFRNKAEGKQLRELGKTVLGLDPLDAVAARRIITVRGTGLSSFKAGEIVIQAANGVTFTNLFDVQFSEADGGPTPESPDGKAWLDIEMIASTPGVAGNLSPGAVLSVLVGEGITGPKILGVEESESDTVISSVGNTFVSIPVGDNTHGQEVRVADLEHAISLGKIAWVIRNPNSFEAFFTLSSEVLSSSGVTIGKTEIQLLKLAALEERVVTFSGYHIDATGNEQIVVALVNGPSSQGPIEVKVSDTAAYSGGAFRVAGVPQNDLDAMLTITTSVDAEVVNGTDEEDDVDYQIRWSKRKDIAGAGHPEAVVANVREVRFVKSADYDFNFEDFPTQNGVPPHTGMIFVQGGRPNEVAQAIYEKWPFGFRWFGNVYGMAVDKAGRVIPVPFFRPTDVKVYVKVITDRSQFFRPNLDRLAIIDGTKGYLGGTLSNGLKVDGLEISENVDFERVVKFAQNFDDAERKLKGSKILIGTDPDNLSQEDILIPRGSVAVLEEVDVI